MIQRRWRRQSSLWNASNPLPLPLSPPPPTPHSSKAGEPYLCLDHASSLVSQVLQGSGNINLFSTCNRARIGMSSKRRSNPAHICQSLFMPCCAPFGTAQRLKIITFIPGKKTWTEAMDCFFLLNMHRVCIFWGKGKVHYTLATLWESHLKMTSNLPIILVYSSSAAVIAMINLCNSCFTCNQLPFSLWCYSGKSNKTPNLWVESKPKLIRKQERFRNCF